jgi:hypothetical protein
VLLLRDLPRAVPEAGPVGADVLAPHEPPGEGPGGSDAARFRVWDAVVELLVAAATHRPLLVVLDDLHWADASSLRLLRHLVESVGSARLVVVGTRRARPLPTGPLAQAGESMARRGAVRVDLAGLEPADVGSLVQATTGRRPSGDEAALLARRTGGNAFFVTELARLPAGRLDAEVPAAVTDVVRARLQHLPEESQDVLRTAAVVGRRFDVALVAAAAGVREDDVLDRLDPALEAGLVADDGAEAFRFSHAIVRDAVYAAVPASRRARRHAAVADALDSRRVAPSGTARSEAARHWLAAGPAHTARAWPAAARAADEAGAMLAHEEAVELLAAAVQAQRSDPAATALDRYDLLMAHAEACRRVADRETLDEVVLAAVAQADLLGDDDRLARAAVGTVDGAVWLTRYYGEVNQPLVDALHRSLARVPPHDSELRCRVLLALAVELYYAAAPREREALVEQGLAMARRLGDPRLLVWACTAAFTAIWRGETAPERYRIAREALDAAERGGDATHLALARTLLSIASLETGRIDRMRAETAAARALAERLRLPYHLVVLGLLEVPWLALEGRLEAAERLLAETSALMQRTSMPARNESPAAAALVLLMAQDRIESDALPMILTVADASAMPLEPSVLALLTRAGRIEQARERYASRGGMHLDHDTWLTPLCLCLAAEAALALELRDVAAEVYGRLAPLAGRPCSGGSGAALGPVDGFLALAALAAGEPAVATRHADDAARLCAEWGVPVAARWLEGHRERAGF